MKPKMDVLPSAQRALWPKLAGISRDWVLYGGTAVALHLGHRESVDFDFFSANPLNKKEILKSLDFLQEAEQTQPEVNTLNCFLETAKGGVKFQFLGGLGNRQGRVCELEVCEDNQIQIPALLDLFATKLNTVQSRAEKKDYIDVEAIIKSGIPLEKGLGAARAVFGKSFDPLTSLRALSWFGDGDLSSLSDKTKTFLGQVVSSVGEVPEMSVVSTSI